MSWPSLPRYVFSAVAALFVLNLDAAQANQSANGAQPQPLVPCLAVAADGTPIMPGTTLPSSRKMTVGFRLPADDASKVLKSRWVALVVSTEGDIAENTLDL